MKKRVKQFKKGIEAYYVNGDWFDEKKIKKLRLEKFHNAREEIYIELDKMKEPIFDNVARWIDWGFLYVAKDDDPFHNTQRIYAEARVKADKYLSKINEELQSKDSFFKSSPLVLRDHPLDASVASQKKGRPADSKVQLIKFLSDAIRPHFPEIPRRSRFICMIFSAFYGLMEDHRSIRKHF